MCGRIGLFCLSVRNVDKARASRAVILDVEASLGAVVFACRIPRIIEELCHHSGDLGTLDRLDRDLGSSHHILTHVKNELLSLFKKHLLASVTNMLGKNSYFAKVTITLDSALMNHRAHRSSVQSGLFSYLVLCGNYSREINTKIVIDRGIFPGVCLGCYGGVRDSGIVIFTVPNTRKANGATRGGLPALVRGDQLRVAVLVLDLDLAAECSLSVSVEAKGDSACPPASGDRGYENVFVLDKVGDIIFKFKGAVSVIGPAGLEFIIDHSVRGLFANALTVQEKIKNTERRRANDYSLYGFSATGNGKALQHGGDSGTLGKLKVPGVIASALHTGL